MPTHPKSLTPAGRSTSSATKKRTKSSHTYQDDIILDQTRPTIENAIATPTSSTSSRTAAAARRVYRVRVTAKDKTSGVQRMQITHRKSRPGDWLRYKRTRSYASNQKKVFVRVQDRAGNVFRWKRIA